MSVVITPIEKKKTKVLEKISKHMSKTCSVDTLKTRLPILSWLPVYQYPFLVQDLIAGLTVALTAIPQGIAYAVIAGLSPEYGLYAGLTSGVVYMFFGSCKAVTVGPTAIMAAMVARYVSDYSGAFAILAAFFSGCFIFLLGILQLGWIVEFISEPVISGFTNASALQIASAQLRSLFGLAGRSGNNVLESLYYFVINIRTARLWDPILGFSSIAVLLLLEKQGKGCKRTDGGWKSCRWFISLSRNAIVVIVGMLIAYIVKVATGGDEPLQLIGDIGSGIPRIGLPEFTTVVNGETFYFRDVLAAFGPNALVLPFVAILGMVAIAKAFSDGKPVDATQEMIVLGLCNIIGSFFQAMPITGSFTRTALNHASGVQTPLGGIVTGLILLLALILITSTFYFIPRTTLAALILTAMFSMIEYQMFRRLWRNSKKELLILVLTMVACMFLGLEYGIVLGIAIDAALLLYVTARPQVKASEVKYDNEDFVWIALTERVAYCAGDHIRRVVLKLSNISDKTILIDGANLAHMDSTVTSNLVIAIKDLERNSKEVVLLNFKERLQRMLLEWYPKLESQFVSADSIEAYLETSNKKRKGSV